MSALLLLLSACVSLGLSYEYGERYRIRIPRNTQVIGFTHDDYSDERILWRREGPSASDDGRHRVSGSYFVIDKLTQRDSGTYRLQDADRNVLSTKTIQVSAHERDSTRNEGEYFSTTYDLESYSCNIYFIPSDNTYEKISLVRHGILQDDLYDHECTGFELSYPCGITNDYVQVPCMGRYEIRDENGDLAVEESLHIESLPYEFDTQYIGLAVGVVSALLSCCCCMRRCCCKKSSSKKDAADSPDAEPATYYHEYNQEPTRLRTDEPNPPSETLYPTLPSYNLTTLIHSPPSESMPPAYSEVSAPAEQADPQPPTLPVPSEDPEPRFQLSFPLAPPLSSNSDVPDVYTSDKLNFN